jgi:hypothetical protein
MNKADVQYYTDLETPYIRYHKFIKYLTIQSEVGSEAGNIQQRANRALQYLEKGDTESVKAELSNLKMLSSFIQNEIIPEGLAVASMVKSIGGVEYNDLSIEGLNKVLLQLDSLGITKSDVSAKNEEIKKKSRLNWRSIFRIFSRGKA